MPLSIFNSDSIERVVPKKRWIKLGIISLFIASFFSVCWEIYWREQGYTPTLNDNSDLWVLQREKIDKNPDATVLIGSSRMLFGFNLSEWEKAFGVKPVQLATVATNPNVYLDHLANETGFRGILLMGVVPMIFFAPEGTPIELPTKNINYYNNFSYAQRWSHYIGLPLDKNLAFIESEDLPLKNLIDRLPIPNRKDAKVPPPIPPFFMEADSDRQGKMIKKVEKNENFKNYMKAIWVNYFTPPPPPSSMSEDEFKVFFAKHIEDVLSKAQANVQKIKSRGGKVILIRYPSTGNVKRLETLYTPRNHFWDKIVEKLNPNFAIHYEDYPELQGFDCPEESHLNAESAKKFTRRMITIIQKQKGL